MSVGLRRTCFDTVPLGRNHRKTRFWTKNLRFFRIFFICKKL